MNQSNSSVGPLSVERTGEADSTPILLTKLHRPPVGPDIEPRPKLLERLDRNRHRPLTLILAPPGYGKTTLASMWLQASDCPSAWVSLDERDDDLLTFTEYLLAALLGAFPTMQFETQALLRAPAAPSASTVARYLLNDLQQITECFILALDDIHLVRQQAIFDLLTELLRHPLPSVHLALIGRRDPPLPITTLRARGQVTEIRARDLRFAPSETARLLSQILDRDIDDEIADKWTQKTEGWVTALRLAALALLHTDPTDDLRINVPGSSQYLEDYLLAEVLSHLPPATRDWLLKVSLLDRFCAPLCEAACRLDAPPEGADLTGEGFVRWLQDQHLFVFALDHEDRWFRFHHLFKGFLQKLLQRQQTPEEMSRVHLRASNWCAENSLLDEAIRYALAAQDIAAAVQLVVRHRYALMNTEQWHRLERWLKLLPADAVAQNPLLLNARAFLALHHGDEGEAIAAQQQASLVLAASSPLGGLLPEGEERKVTQAEIALLSYLQDFYSRQFARAVSKGQNSLEVLPPQALHVRTLAISCIAFGLQLGGDVTQSTRVLREALGDPAWPASIRTKLVNGLATACSMQGDLNEVLELGNECLRIAEEQQLPQALSWGRYHLGTAHYLRNDLAQAELYLLALVEDRALSSRSYLTFGAFALALVYHSQGRGSEAAQLIELVSTYLRETERDVSSALVEVFRVELAIRRGDVAEARQLSERTTATARLPRWYFYLPQLTQFKLVLAEGTPEGLADARMRLESLDEELHKNGLSNARIDVLAILALVHDALGEEAAALDRLGAALGLAEPGGFVRNFLDLGPPMADLLGRLHHQQETLQSTRLPYLAHILAAFPAGERAGARTTPSPGASGPALDPGERVLPSPPSLAEPLTAREFQLLELLATERSPQEIAGELCVSTTTVRTHIRHIYAKLDAHSRFEAVHHARELGLL